MTWFPDAKDKDHARYLQQAENTRINRKRLLKLKQQPCTDCKLRWHPHAMSLDHIDRTGLKMDKNGRPVNINACTYWNPVAFNKQLAMMEPVMPQLPYDSRG